MLGRVAYWWSYKTLQSPPTGAAINRSRAWRSFFPAVKCVGDLHKHRIICDYHTTYDVVVDGLSTSRLAAYAAPSLSTCCFDLGKMCQQLVGTFGFSAPLSCESCRISGWRVGSLGNALANRCMDELRRFPHLATPPVASGKWRLMQLSLTHTHAISKIITGN